MFLLLWFIYLLCFFFLLLCFIYLLLCFFYFCECVFVLWLCFPVCSCVLWCVVVSFFLAIVFSFCDCDWHFRASAKRLRKAFEAPLRSLKEKYHKTNKFPFSHINIIRALNEPFPVFTAEKKVLKKTSFVFFMQKVDRHLMHQRVKPDTYWFTDELSSSKTVKGLCYRYRRCLKWFSKQQIAHKVMEAHAGRQCYCTSQGLLKSWRT